MAEELPPGVGEMAQLGQMFGAHRAELLRLAHRRLYPSVEARVAPEDILAKDFQKAIGRWSAFQASGLPPAKWLHRLVLDCLFDEHDRQTAQGRDIHREVSWPGNSSSQFELGLVSPGTSPSE